MFKLILLINRQPKNGHFYETEKTLYSIMGKTNVSVSQMVKFYKNKATVSYPYSNVSEAPTIEKFCQIYKEESEVEGVKAEVAFAQAMMETGFLRFGGDVKKSSIILPVLEQLEMELQVMDLNLFGLEFERRYSI